MQNRFIPVYDHDSIHDAMKHLRYPAYQYYKPAVAEVFCSQEMFNKQHIDVRLYGVLEEALVLALERSQIPFNYEPDPKKSFDIALNKVCTSITSGWFREFAWEHYDRVQEMYNSNYVDRFKKALADGIIKPFTGSMY